MKVPFVNLRAQYEALKPEIDRAVLGIFERGHFVGGPDLDDFERWFADYCGVSHAIGVSSGTTALELTLRALGVGPGDEVVTVPHTFIASAAAITATGARPVLVDVDEKTGMLAPDLLSAAITSKTRAVLPVHLYGHPAPMKEILDVAVRHGLPVVEDAAQAHGARCDGGRTGGLATAGCFSFYPTKNLGAFGDGGLVTTSDETVARGVRLLRDHGRTSKYEHAVVGQTARLDNVQAAILRLQADRLDDWNAQRRRAAGWYRRDLASTPVILPHEAAGAEPVYHLYVVRTSHRDALRAHLEAHGVATGIHYPIPVHLQPAYRELGYSQGDLPVSERLAGEVLSLPMHPFLTEADIAYVAQTVTGFFATC